VAYRNVIVGTDGSATAELAVQHAAQLATAQQARLVIVTAYTPQGDAMAADARTPDELRWMLTDRNQAEELARHGRELAKGEGATGVVVQSTAGEPVEVILDTAKDFDADLIVVGSKGLTSAARFVLGSVASSVSHHAPCDVLVVHTIA
jgi:nucleotide-binding universal stress UspA family protein